MKVVAVSKGLTDNLCNMGVPQKVLQTISNPVAGLYVAHQKSHKPFCVDDLSPKKYILTVGLVSPKGFDRLLHAFASLADLDVHLVILGEGDERQSLQNLAQSLGLAKRVHLHGIVADVTPWYMNAACFVLSSRRETYGNVLVEAMVCACPVVSFDCPYGPSEIIQHEHNGLLVEEGNVAGLTSAIERVLQDSTLHNTLVQQGMQTAKKFDVANIASKWLT